MSNPRLLFRRDRDRQVEKFIAGGRHTFDITAYSQIGHRLVGETPVLNDYRAQSGVAAISQREQYLEVTFAKEGPLRFSVLDTEIVGEVVGVEQIP